MITAIELVLIGALAIAGIGIAAALRIAKLNASDIEVAVPDGRLVIGRNRTLRLFGRKYIVTIDPQNRASVAPNPDFK
jgi:hypothetical protein